MCIAIDEMREDARKEGMEQGQMQTLSDLVKDGLLTLADAAKTAGLSPAEFQKKTAGLSPAEFRKKTAEMK